jgi:hypothetical protein
MTTPTDTTDHAGPSELAPAVVAAAVTRVNDDAPQGARIIAHAIAVSRAA